MPNGSSAIDLDSIAFQETEEGAGDSRPDLGTSVKKAMTGRPALRVVVSREDSPSASNTNYRHQPNTLRFESYEEMMAHYDRPCMEMPDGPGYANIHANFGALPEY